MPLATPKPSGEWQAATSVQARRTLGAGPATAGVNTRGARAPAEAATPKRPTALRTLRRETDLCLVLSVTGVLQSFDCQAALRADWAPVARPALSIAWARSAMMSSGC